MKLATQSIPYRALQKVSGLVILLFFISTANDWGLLLAIGGSVAVIAIAVAYEVAYYRRFEYELTDDTLDISSGVISRREREIPYRRIQNVDVSRNVLQRAIGVAAVDLETAGGSSTEGSIQYVVPDEATRLQREIQRRKSRSNGTERSGSLTADSTRSEDDGTIVEPVEEDLYVITPGELALVGALSFDGRLIGLLAFLASGSVPVLSGFVPTASAVVLSAFAIVAVGVLFLVSWILGAGIAFSNYYGFRLARAGDELRYERGLFRRFSGSIPTEKVQTLTITDNPAKRAVDYASLSIETAGYAPGQGGEHGSQAAVPIAKTERVYELAREVEPFGTPAFSRPPTRIRWRYAFRYTMVIAVLTGIASAVDWWIATAVPWYLLAGLLLFVPLAAHLKWKHRGYWLGADHLVTRNGFWSREVRIVPYYRIQNVIDQRTFFQRRWNVATVVADTAGTSSLVGSDAVAVDFDTAEAATLTTELRSRLQAAVRARRAHRSSFQWVGDDRMGDTDHKAGDAASGRDTSSTAESNAEIEKDESDSQPDSMGMEDRTDQPDVADSTQPTGVVSPTFTAADREYGEPAPPIDSGDYAVDRYPSDTSVTHRSDDIDDNDTSAVGDLSTDDAATDDNAEASADETSGESQHPSQSDREESTDSSS